MPTPTYTLISETVLGSAQASVTFSSIPQTYKDLVLEIVASNTAANTSTIQGRFNGDSAANYSFTYLNGNGSSAASGRVTGNTVMGFGETALSEIGSSFVHVFSYANTSVNKTTIVRANTAGYYAQSLVNLWRSTAAVNSLSVISAGGNFSSGSTFRLWGVVG